MNTKDFTTCLFSFLLGMGVCMCLVDLADNSAISLNAFVVFVV